MRYLNMRNMGAYQSAINSIIASLPLGSDLTGKLSGAVTFARTSGVYVTDYAGTLQYVPAGCPTFEGGRLTYDLAKGAALGTELITNGNMSSATGWNALDAGAVISNGVLTFNGSDANPFIYQVVTQIGKFYQSIYTVVSITGTIRFGGSSAPTTRSTPGTYTETWQAAGINTGPQTLNNSLAVVDNVSVKEIIPAFVDTALDGVTPLHPYVFERGAKRYLTFDQRAAGVVTALNKRVWALASDGLAYWYTATVAGTTSGTPTFPTSGTVVDGGVTWAYGGLYRSPRLLIEPLSVNKCTCYGVPRVDSLGAEKVNNGTFSTNTWWSFDTDTSWDNVNLRGTFTGVSTDRFIRGATDIPFARGKIYLFTVVVVNYVSGNLYITSGDGIRLLDVNTGTFIVPIVANGTYTFYVGVHPASTNPDRVMLGNISGIINAQIDSVSLKEAIDYVGTKAYHNGTAFVNPVLNMTLSGDVAAVLSIALDAAGVTAAGLDNVVNAGKMYKVTTGAGGAGYIDFAGAMTGALTSMSVVYRVASGSIVLSDNDNANATASLTSATYARAKKDGFTSTNTKLTRLRVAASSVIYFGFVQNETDAANSTSIMPSVGATATRTATTASIPTVGNIPASPGWELAISHFVRQTTGTQTVATVGTTTDDFKLVHNGTAYVLNKYVGGAATAVTHNFALVSGQVNKLDIRVNNDWTFDLFCNGVKATTGNTTTTAALGTLAANLYLGTDSAGANGINGGLRNFRTVRRAFSDAEDIAFTSAD